MQKSKKNIRIPHKTVFDKCSAVAEMGDRLATVDMGRKEGGCRAAFFAGGSWVPI